MPTRVTQVNLQRGKGRDLNFCDKKDQLCYNILLYKWHRKHNQKFLGYSNVILKGIR